MDRIKKFFVFLIILLIPSISFARDYSYSQIEKIYNKFYEKIEKKYNYDTQKELNFLKKLDFKLNFILKKKKLSKKIKKILIYLKILNYKKILYLSQKKIDNYNSGQKKLEEKDNLSIKSKKENNIDFLEKQKKLEENIRKKFLNLKINNPNYIKNLINSWKKIYYLNDKLEFLEDSKIKRLNFSSFYRINSWNYSYFKNKSWVVAYTKKYGYIFVVNYKEEEKIPYSRGWDFLYWLIWDDHKFLFNKVDNYYYWFKFSKYSKIDDDYWFYLSDIKRFWFWKDTLLFFNKEKDKFYFVNDYKKIKLVDENYVKYLVNKDLFLEILAEDLSFYNTKDYLKTLENIKKNTLSITRWVAKEEKILNIYEWIVSNISYSKNFKLTDYEIFSWLETYKRKSWVCEWYVKLASYMLIFAGIWDVEIKKWFVIDAKDFPEIWHAWLRIWDKYYDPTFDDPVWLSKSKKTNEFKYFALPKDLFYTNRFDYWKLPEKIKKLSLEERKNLINKNLFLVYDKYKNKNYNLLKIVKFKKKYWFSYDEKITLNNFSRVLPLIEVRNFSFKKNWTRKYIKRLKYFIINNDNLESLLEQIDYNLDWKYFFLWYDKNGNKSYRLAYDVEFE